MKQKTTEELILQVVENDLPHIYKRLGAIEALLISLATALPANKRWAMGIAASAVGAILTLIVKTLVD